MTQDRRRRAVSALAGWAFLALLGAVTIASALALAAAASVVPSMFTSPVSISAFTACCLALAVFAGMRRGRGARGRTVGPLSVTVAFTVWFAAIAVMTWSVGVDGLRGPWAIALVAIAGSMHVPVLTLLLWPALADAQRWRRALLLLAAPAWLLGALFVEPANPWGSVGAVWESPIGAAAGAVFTTLWALALLAAPVVLWRRASRPQLGSRRAHVLAAVAATAPLLGVGLATIAGALLWAGADRAALGSATIVGLCASSLVATVCADLARSPDARPPANRALRALVLGVAVAPIVVLVAVAAAVLAHAAGDETIATTLISLVVAGSAALATVPVVGRMLRLADSEPTASPTTPAGEAPAPVAIADEPAPARPRLTARESAVAEGLARGLSNAAIARELVVSERTVHAHVRAIYAKLGLPADGEHNQRVTAANALRADTAEMPMQTGSAGR